MNFVIIGCGGHAREVAAAWVQAHPGGPSPHFWSELRDDTPPPGYARTVLVQQCPGDTFHVAIGNNAARERVAEAIKKAFGYPTQSVVAQHVIGLPHHARDGRFGYGVYVGEGAYIAPDAWIGDGAIINRGAHVGHGCTIGRYAQIAPLANLGGGCVVGDGALVGLSAVVLPGVHIEVWATVGAGAVVTKRVKSYSTVVGNPARRHDAPKEGTPA
jgi:acetyltransferase EpsM